MRSLEQNQSKFLTVTLLDAAHRDLAPKTVLMGSKVTMKDARCAIVSPLASS